MAVFGETSGLYPQLLLKKANIYRRRNWDPNSFKQLQEARKYIADVVERNKKVRSMKPCGDNSIEHMVWQDSLIAAAEAEKWNLPGDVKHFYMRQGTKLEQPDWAIGKVPYATFGPFINVGGGSVPKGSETYIDFYQGVR